MFFFAILFLFNIFYDVMLMQNINLMQ